MLQSRKGISPLIATVLLIAFAVALGAVVMSWGRGYIETTATFAEEKSAAEMRCTMDVELDYAIVNNQKKVCFGDMNEDNINITDLDYDEYVNNKEAVEEVPDFDPTAEVDYIEMVIENGRSTELVGLQITVLGKKEIVSFEYNRTITEAAMVRIRLPWNVAELGDIEQI